MYIDGTLVVEYLRFLHALCKYSAILVDYSLYLYLSLFHQLTNSAALNDAFENTDAQKRQSYSS